MVPGNRVVIGLSGDVPQAAAIIKAISERLVAAGIEPANITLLQACHSMVRHRLSMRLRRVS